MLRLLKFFFLSLGVIFFVLLIIVGYFVYTSGINPSTFIAQPPSAEEKGNATESKDSNPYLSATQEASLRAVGINPASLPTSLTDTQKNCLINIVGESRAAQIVSGATPTAIEIFNAKSCL